MHATPSLRALSSSDGTEEERNKVDQQAKELGQPVDELERANALTLNVEPDSADCGSAAAIASYVEADSERQ
ncbi:hypothetical protein Tco_1408344 [Tanacetum coccineum]